MSVNTLWARTSRRPRLASAREGKNRLHFDLAPPAHGDGLWAFRVNTPALRFYERHGFVEVTRTDGSRNEENEPDVRLE